MTSLSTTDRSKMQAAAGATDAAAPSTEAAAPEQVLAKLASLMDHEGPGEQFLEAVLSLMVGASGAVGGAFLRTSDRPGVEVVKAHPPVQDADVVPRWLHRAIDRLHRGELTQTEAIRLDTSAQTEQRGSAVTLLVPLRSRPGTRRAVVFGLRDVPADHADELARTARRTLLEMTLALLEQFEQRLDQGDAAAKARELGRVLRVLDAVNSAEHFKAAAMAFCNELHTAWQADRVSLGVVRGRYVRVMAMSQTEHIIRKMRLVHDLEAAMEECLDQGVETMHPAPIEAVMVNRMARALSEAHGPTQVICFPLHHGMEVVGVVAFETAIRTPVSARAIESLRLACNLCTARLHDRSRQDRWVGARLASWSKDTLKIVLGPRHTLTKLLVLLALALVITLAVARGTDRVEAPFTIEPTWRQVVSAPFDGYLASATADVGDVVEPNGPPLAMLETGELELRLASLKAELVGYEKEASLARREGNTVEMQMGQAQADRVRSEMRLIEQQLTRAALRTPERGIVVEGELDRRVGSALQKGEPLMEIAGLDSLVAKLKAPESRVSDLTVGQRGELATAARPGVYLPFVVRRIDPVAEVVDGQNVFEVTAELDASAPWLRPGMAGLAKVEVDQDVLYAWMWTRDAINWVRMKLWW